MAAPAKKIEDSLPESAPRPISEDEGVVLSPDEEMELEQMIAETDEDLRAGRFCTFDEMRARLRAA